MIEPASFARSVHLHWDLSPWRRLQHHLPAWCAAALLCAAGWGGAASVGAGHRHRRQVAVRPKTVMGILGYTRWPSEPETVQLCVVGPTEYADALLKGGQLPGARVVQVRRMRLEDAALLTQCHGVYAGRLDDRAWQALRQRLQGQPLLSISERQELCQTDCMFCLDVRDAGVGFETNLDAVARSGVRVNPRVLQLARRKGGA